VHGSGKSTLAAHLISNGFKLLHDDTIILRASDGDMMPTTMPLSIKVGSWSVLQTSFPQLVNLTEFGQGPRRVKLLTPDISQVCTESVKCKVIVSPKWVSKPQDPVLEKISVEEQFAEIIEGGCFFERPICPAYLKKFVTWLDRFPCYKLTYNRLDQALDTINSLV